MDSTIPAQRQNPEGRPKPRFNNAFVRFEKGEIEQSITSRFEKQAARNRDRPAIKTKEQTWSYGELDRIANRIAHAVLAKGAVKNEPVVIMVENDAGSLAAILGVLKAGKICVPLDFALPQPAAAAIVENSQATIVVANNKYLRTQELIPCAAVFINVENLDPGISDAKPRLPKSLSAQSCAHIIYTTGSTGSPKGVVDIHRNVLHHVMRVTNSSLYCADDRVTLLRAASSWGGLANAYYALLNGACLFPFNIQAEGMSRLPSWLIEEKITVYHSSATVFRHFVDGLDEKAEFPDLRLIKLGSERVTKNDFLSYKKHFSNTCALVNALSCTEAGMFRYNLFGKNTEVTSTHLAVGYPVEDMEVLLLDEKGAEVEAGQIGEIAVKSEFLASGYWRNQSLTSKCFSTASPGSAQRIYCTGDMGRMQSDGCLEYLGRKDFQTKVRGYRVRLDEIEMVLLDIPEIEQAIVVARQDGSGDQRLIAYVVPRRGQSITVGRLRAVLRGKIASYMIPSSFVLLDALPLTTNGKVNRDALPATPTIRPDLDEPFQMPRTAVETVLARIWSEVLHIDQVGANDSFFELGGDSLSGSRLLSLVNQTFHCQVGLNNLFEAPTPTELSHRLACDEAVTGQITRIAEIALGVNSMKHSEIQQVLREQKLKTGDG